MMEGERGCWGEVLLQKVNIKSRESHCMNICTRHTAACSRGDQAVVALNTYHPCQMHYHSLYYRGCYRLKNLLNTLPATFFAKPPEYIALDARVDA